MAAAASGTSRLISPLVGNFSIAASTRLEKLALDVHNSWATSSHGTMPVSQ